MFSNIDGLYMENVIEGKVVVSDYHNNDTVTIECYLKTDISARETIFVVEFINNGEYCVVHRQRGYSSHTIKRYLAKFFDSMGDWATFDTNNGVIWVCIDDEKTAVEISEIKYI